MDGNIRWVPPLPAGWEAKYEPTQQRYFFINHSSKQTTWDDPRFSRQPPAPVSPARVSHVVRGRQAAQPQSQNYGYGSAQRQPYHQQQRQAEALPMKHMAGQYVAGQQYQQGALWQQRAAEQQAQEMAQMRARQALQHHYEDDSEEDESIFIEDVVELEVDDQLMHTLREQYPSCPPGKIRSILEKNCNALRASQLDIEAMGFEKVGQSEQRNRPSSHSNEGNYEMAVQRLKREFNQAEITLIRDIIRQCDGDEINAREQLKNLGFQEASPVQEAIPERHRDLASEEREHQRTLSSSSPQRTASPKRPSLSEREKETLITKLCRDFPNLDRTIVELAFETAGSTEDKARHLLQFMYTDNSSSATSPKRTTSPVRQATTSPSRSSAATASNNQSLATTGPSAAESSSRPGSSKSRGGTQSASPPKPTASSSNNALRQQQKKVPKQPSDYLYETASYDVLGILESCCQQASTPEKSDQSKSDESDDSVTKVKVTGRDQVVTSQQQVRAQRRTDDHYQVLVSNNRTAAKGPDPSLSEGPDLKRVERYGVLPKGPNPDLRKGPNRSLVKGSQGAMGPDPSLRRGPQANLRHGPQADLCRGPAFQKSPARVLVSNI